MYWLFNIHVIPDWLLIHHTFWLLFNICHPHVLFNIHVYLTNLDNYKGPYTQDIIECSSSINREPERHAIWCITCLLMAGSINPTLRAVYPVVVHKMYPDEDWLDRMLCTAANLFYNQNVSFNTIVASEG